MTLTFTPHFDRLSVAQAGQVKLSFFGGIGFGRVGEPEFTDDGVLQVAALDDLMTGKLKVVLQRAEAKDYRDIAAMLGTGIDLAYGIAAARVLFGPNSSRVRALKHWSISMMAICRHCPVRKKTS